jgi:hypothetical protein
MNESNIDKRSLAEGSEVNSKENTEAALAGKTYPQEIASEDGESSNVNLAREDEEQKSMDKIRDQIENSG